MGFDQINFENPLERNDNPLAGSTLGTVDFLVGKGVRADAKGQHNKGMR